MSSDGHPRGEYLNFEVSQFRERVESIRDQAEQLMNEFRVPDEDDWVIDPRELSALAQRIRITCADLLDRMERLLDDAVASERSGTAFLMHSSLNSLLAEIDALEERLFELLASCEVQSTYQVSSPSRRAAIVHSVSWIGRHIKAALKGALRSLWESHLRPSDAEGVVRSGRAGRWRCPIRASEGQR